jgi:hypothetical protein
LSERNDNLSLYERSSITTAERIEGNGHFGALAVSPHLAWKESPQIIWKLTTVLPKVRIILF